MNHFSPPTWDLYSLIFTFLISSTNLPFNCRQQFRPLLIACSEDTTWMCTPVSIIVHLWHEKCTEYCVDQDLMIHSDVGKCKNQVNELYVETITGAS